MSMYTHREHPVLKAILHVLEISVISIVVAFVILFLLVVAFSAAG